MVAVPLKLRAGVNTTFVPAMSAVPLVGLTDVMINGSPSGSLSLTSGLMVTETSSSVLVASFTAMGGSFTGVTLTVISALAVPPLTSLMLYPMGAVPLFGLTDVMINVSPVGSLSLISGWMVTETSSSVLVASFTAMGGSFTGVTVMVISALAVPPLPSLIL